MKLIATIDGTEYTPLMEGSVVNIRRPVSSATILLDDPDSSLSVSCLDPISIEIDNKIIYSEDPSQSEWVKAFVDTPVSATLDPVWGVFPVRKLEEDTSTNPHLIYQAGLTNVSSIPVCWSVYLKADGVTTVRPAILQRDLLTAQFADVDLSTGTITGTGGSPTSTAIQDLGSGWYRVSIVGTSGTGSNPCQAYVQLQDGTSYLGDGSSGVLMFGAMWQEASSLDTYRRTMETSTTFSGFVNAIDYVPDGKSGSRRLKLDCLDWNWRLDNPPGLVTKVYQDTDDQTIILDALSECGLDSSLTASSSTIASVQSGITVAFDGATMREVLDEMTKASGAAWSVQNTTLRYNTEGAVPLAPWSIDTDTPSAGSSYDVQKLTRTQRHDFPVNSAEVVGPLSEGARASGSDSDATSIAAIGTYQRKFEIATATVDSYATLLAQQIVAAGKDPRDSITFECDDSGSRPPLTSVTQRMRIDSDRFELTAQDFVTREIRIKQLYGDVSQFNVQAGSFQPSVTDLLRRLESASRSGTSAPQSIGALRFTASSSEAVNSTSTSLTNIDNTADFTIFATIEVDSITSTRTIAAMDDGSNLGWTLTVTSFGLISLIRTRASSNYSYSRTFPGGGFVAGQVYRIVVASDTATGARFWINGVEATSGGGGTVGSGAFDAAASSPFRVGRDNGGAYMDGAIGGVAFWNIALPETTCAGLHNVKFSSLPFPNDIQLAWALDEFDVGSSALGTDSIIDRSANGYDGTPANTPTGATLVYIVS